MRGQPKARNINMIDEYYTWTIFGYHSDDLSDGSHKPIIAVCDECGAYRSTQKRIYGDLCRTCVHIDPKEIMLDRSSRIKKHSLEYIHRAGICSPMHEDKECSAYLGVYVAENVLSNIFYDVTRMPYGTPGYDFICNRGKKIDVKGSCRRSHEKASDNWVFNIRNNIQCDYFLLIAFDNRKTLNPEHLWLIPGSDINHLTGASVSETTVCKWDKYKVERIEQLIEACNIMRRLQ